MVTRRHLLAAAVALATVPAGLAGVVCTWWAQPPQAPLRNLSASEVAFFDALAEAIFPPGGIPELSGREAGVCRYIDGVLAGMAETQRDLFRLSLHALNTLAYKQVGATLPDLDAGQVAEVLRGWLTAADGNLRGLAQSLHILVGMAFLAHPGVSPVVAGQFGCGFGDPDGG